MRNAKIWEVSTYHGSHSGKASELTKKEAKARFEVLAKDTTRNINNDYLDMVIISRNGEQIAQMYRMGKGEYAYWIGKEWTEDGEYAAELLKAI